MAPAAKPPAQKELPLDPKYDDYDFPTTAPTPFNGHPGYTTPEQDAQVHQLRALLEQAGYTKNLDTLTLLRFLRARKFNVELSKQMFVASEKWRGEYAGVGVEELVRTFDYKERSEVFTTGGYPQFYHKTDKDGRPVYIEKLGKVDLKKLGEITTQDRMAQNLVCEYEKMADPRLPACSRKSGYLLETSCSIMDLGNPMIGMGQASSVYPYLQTVSAISQNYYPERLGHMYIINTSWTFRAVWYVIQKWLDPVTVSKIHILGSNYQKELLEQVPAENLPKDLGGTCECEGGCMLSDAGPWQDPQWVKPAKWEKKQGDQNAIDNTQAAAPTEGAAPAPLTGAGPQGVEPAAAPAQNPSTANSK